MSTMLPAATRARVLVIDDEKNIRTTLAVCLGVMGCEVSSAPSFDVALELVEHEPFDIAFLDLRLGNASGMELLPRLLAVQPALAIVLISAHVSMETTIEAVRRGAIDCLPKPFTPAQIRHTVNFILERRSLARSG